MGAKVYRGSQFHRGRHGRGIRDIRGNVVLFTWWPDWKMAITLKA